MNRLRCIWVLLIATLAPAAEPGQPELPAIPPTQSFTFAVLGDNRGDDSGQQPQAFLQVLGKIEEASPAFLLDTGDMIYGHSSDERRVREQWAIYREATRRIRIPMFHVPGNHDIWDEPSARIYHELWGKTYYAFDYGNARFIGLDTETGKGRLGEQQFHWLEQQLESSSQRHVFLFFHRPVFPVDSAIGSSLDEYPAERDRLHQLLIRYHDVIGGVFMGHEHLYSYRVRDGVPYYISGGGGAPLYAAPELGGFHHFLIVRVTGNQVAVELKKACAPTRRLQQAKRVLPGEVLESWQQGLIWFAWDRTANIELTPEQASEGSRGLRLNFDLDQYAWPVLVLSLASPWDLRRYESLSIDVYVPANLGGPFLVTPALESSAKFEAPTRKLKPGWNTVTMDLDASWVPQAAQRRVETVEWGLAADAMKTAAYVIFDKLQAKQRNPNARQWELLESFERPLLWRVFDEAVRAHIIRTNGPAQPHGLRLHLDFAKSNRPVAFAQLNPPWDLSKADALVLEVAVGASLPEDLTIELGIKAKDVEYVSTPLPLHRRTTRVRFELQPSWLPPQAQAASEQIRFTLVSTNGKGAGDLTFEQLSAGGY